MAWGGVRGGRVGCLFFWWVGFEGCAGWGLGLCFLFGLGGGSGMGLGGGSAWGLVFLFSLGLFVPGGVVVVCVRLGCFRVGGGGGEGLVLGWGGGGGGGGGIEG